MKTSAHQNTSKTSLPTTLLKRPTNNNYNLIDTEEEKHLLSFFDIFKNRTSGEKIFAYLQRLGLLRTEYSGLYSFVPKTRSKILPIVCLYKTLNDKGYLKRMTPTEAGVYFCRAFGKNTSSIRMFYCDQQTECGKYTEYFYHIPEHADFLR